MCFDSCIYMLTTVKYMVQFLFISVCNTMQYFLGLYLIQCLKKKPMFLYDPSTQVYVSIKSMYSILDHKLQLNHNIHHLLHKSIRSPKWHLQQLLIIHFVYKKKKMSILLTFCIIR